MTKQIGISAEEQGILKQLTVDQLRQLLDLKEDGKKFQVLLDIVNIVIDTEKNYIFSLNEVGLEPYDLSLKHAFSRGQAAFGTRLLHLISCVNQELTRREKIQQELKKQQGGKDA